MVILYMYKLPIQEINMCITVLCPINNDNKVNPNNYSSKYRSLALPEAEFP